MRMLDAVEVASVAGGACTPSLPTLGVALGVHVVTGPIGSAVFWGSYFANCR